MASNISSICQCFCECFLFEGELQTQTFDSLIVFFSLFSAPFTPLAALGSEILGFPFASFNNNHLLVHYLHAMNTHICSQRKKRADSDRFAIKFAQIRRLDRFHLFRKRAEMYAI